MLPPTVAELQRLEIRVQEVAVDRGFNIGPTNLALADLAPNNVYIAGRQEPGSRHTRRRLRRSRTGGRAESATSHAATGWTEWGILAYDLKMLAVPTR